MATSDYFSPTVAHRAGVFQTMVFRPSNLRCACARKCRAPSIGKRHRDQPNVVVRSPGPCLSNSRGRANEGALRVGISFENCIVSVEQRELTRDSTAVPIGPQVFDLLVVRDAGSLVAGVGEDVLDKREQATGARSRTSRAPSRS